ncbi:ketopantoate reductase family protein [Fredinandcohnia sp. QZ13]|uniref:ketopantoate reductase family protein n=1 Tax=Fredinandcohnia sp. QZ13 TaxID=3073144 RepID=UPI002852FD33|nr:ketopantoate reductase family protein [Fredinandcohnia sp. QZ13]MDR4887289.1 ketopantoate reductase family protein [Fredinandcohnia sp. QZ13]
MRILVVGAGAIGGYFGGRLLEKGEDVTFLVREKRQKQLQDHGLQIESIHGNVTLQPKTIQSGDEAGIFDVIILSTKQYHLEGALHSIEPYVGEDTMILPLLNGYSHVDVLKSTFNSENVLGGLCFIESTLDSEGKIVQTSPNHRALFGEFSGERTERISKLADVMSGTKTNIELSDNIIREMWHKYMFITGFSGVTTLMRSPIGPIREEQNGQKLILNLFKEIGSVMRAIGAPIDADTEEKHVKTTNQMTFEMKSSMQRDMEKGLDIEGDQLQGYLYKIAQEKGIETPLLEVIYSNLRVYQAQRG